MHLLTLAARTLFFYLFLLIAVRVMGKRELGSLSAWDLVLTIMIAELAALPVEDPKLPLINGAVPIATLVLAQFLLGWASLRSIKIRQYVTGVPSIMVRDGRIVESELRKSRYSLDDLLEQLREKGYPNIADVEVAILECSGKLSVIPKSQKRPLRASDIGCTTSYEGIPINLVSDGVIDYNGLKACNLDLTWLKQKLRERGIEDVRQVLLCCIDTNGSLYIQEKENWSSRP